MTMEQTQQTEFSEPESEGQVEQQAPLPMDSTVAEQPQESTVAEAVAPAPGPALAPMPVPETGSLVSESGVAPAPGQSPEYSPDQISDMQRNAAQYQQVQLREKLQKQASDYKDQMEAQGYLPEHAEQAAAQYMQSQERQVTLMQQADQYGKHLQEKQVAVEHFVKKYNLGVEDMAGLRSFESPQSMEEGAKKLSYNRERDAELARLKQAQVPAQSFDNSQGNPQVAADEGGWLDRYNSGDRSSNAQAAAKKAAGIG